MLNIEIRRTFGFGSNVYVLVSKAILNNTLIEFSYRYMQKNIGSVAAEDFCKCFAVHKLKHK